MQQRLPLSLFWSLNSLPKFTGPQVAAVPAPPECHPETRAATQRTLPHAPAGGTGRPDVSNARFSVAPLTPVVCSISTTCYTSVFLVKPGLGRPLPPRPPASARPTCGTEANGLLHPTRSCLSSQPESVRGQSACAQGKVGFVSPTSHSEAGPCSVEHVFGTRSPCVAEVQMKDVLSATSEFHIC